MAWARVRCGVVRCGVRKEPSGEERANATALNGRAKDRGTAQKRPFFLLARVHDDLVGCPSPYVVVLCTCVFDFLFFSSISAARSRDGRGFRGLAYTKKIRPTIEGRGTPR